MILEPEEAYKVLNFEKFIDFNGFRVYQDFFHDPNRFFITKHILMKERGSALHMHDFMQLWYVLSGNAIHLLGGQKYIQSPGDFLIIPPQFSHVIDAVNQEQCSVITCDFSLDLIESMLKDERGKTLFDLVYLRPLLLNASLSHPQLAFSAPVTARLEQALNDLLAEYQRVGGYSLDFVRLNLIKLLSIITQEYARNLSVPDDRLYAKYRSSIQRVFEYIDEKYMENISLQEVVEIAQMSVRSFTSLFKSITGKTFSDYLLHLRVFQASRMLTESDATLTQIAMDCGFYDAAHFTHSFKQLFGIAPNQFRRASRNGELHKMTET